MRPLYGIAWLFFAAPGVALGAPPAVGRAVPSLSAAGEQGGVGESGRRPAVANTSVMQLLRRIDSNLTASRYSHVTRVDEASGSYEFDCSGMVAWVLRRTARRAHAAVLGRSKGNRPLARDYYGFIAAVKPGVERYGWQRVAKASEMQPGDVLAWLKPEIIRSPSTGHVAFVVEPPRAIPGLEEAYLVRIADASQYQHENDSRADSGRTGFGFGTILIVADRASGMPAAYGWVGRNSAWILPAKIAIGRPMR